MRGDKKREILEAARETFGSRGYRNTCVEDIIRHAGVARATFYHYFDNKHACFRELVERLLERIRVEVLGPISRPIIDASDIREVVHAAFINTFNIFMEENAFISTYIRELLGLDAEIDGMVLSFQDDAARAVEDFLGRCEDRGLIRHINKRVAAATLAGAPQHLAIHLVLMRGSSAIEDFADTITDMFLSGIIEPGRAMTVDIPSLMMP